MTKKSPCINLKCTKWVEVWPSRSKMSHQKHQCKGKNICWGQKTLNRKKSIRLPELCLLWIMHFSKIYIFLRNQFYCFLTSNQWVTGTTEIKHVALHPDLWARRHITSIEQSPECEQSTMVYALYDKEPEAATLLLQMMCVTAVVEGPVFVLS